MIDNTFVCPGTKQHILNDEKEYLNHLKECQLFETVKEVYICRYFKDHIFRGERLKQRHEV